MFALLAVNFEPQLRGVIIKRHCRRRVDRWHLFGGGHELGCTTWILSRYGRFFRVDDDHGFNLVGIWDRSKVANQLGGPASRRRSCEVQIC